METKEITFKDAVYNSTAQPDTFKKVKIQDMYEFWDGGEGGPGNNNNNPTISLIAEAIQQGYSLENIHVISLGTGTLAEVTGDSDPISLQEHDKNLFWSQRPYANTILQETE